MKKLFTLLSLSLSLSLVKADYWTQKADVGGGGRDRNIGFFIGNKGYIGLGVDGGLGFKDDFWEFEPSTNTWTQKANFGGLAKNASVGFSIGTKGYAGTGQDTTQAVSGDFWEYDPVTNAWTQKASFAVLQRVGATGFSIGTKGYIGMGQGPTNFLNDFWEYDPILNSWTQKANLPGFVRASACGFSIGTKGYIGTGSTALTGGILLNDFWEYDPVANSWSQKANFPGIARWFASCFSIGLKGYIGLGANSNITTVYNDFWEYNPAANTWTQKTNFGGVARLAASGFTIGPKGYIGTGSVNLTNPLDDFWEYTPDSTTNIEELPTSNLDFTISPNPAKDYIVISYPSSGKENIYITITDAQGKKVYETKLLTSDFRLPTSDFSKGIYFAEVSNGKQKAVKKFVKE